MKLAALPLLLLFAGMIGRVMYLQVREDAPSLAAIVARCLYGWISEWLKSSSCAADLLSRSALAQQRKEAEEARTQQGEAATGPLQNGAGQLIQHSPASHVRTTEAPLGIRSATLVCAFNLLFLASDRPVTDYSVL